MRNQNISISVIMALAIVFALTMVSASSISNMTSPVSWGNYTKTLTVTVNVQEQVAGNTTNVTCFYNSTGTAATSLLVTIVNTTAGQRIFTGTASLVTESSVYNVSCNINNATTFNMTLYASNITIDGTNPAVSMIGDVPQISQNGIENLVWSSTDSHLRSTAVTITSPNSALCPTLSYTDAVSSRQLMNAQTTCGGTYTATILGTDYSGNTATSTDTWIVNIPDGQFMGANSNIGTNYPGKSTSNTNWILIAVVVIVIILLVRKK